jgi:hypothetical protein
MNQREKKKDIYIYIYIYISFTLHDDGPLVPIPKIHRIGWMLARHE